MASGLSGAIRAQILNCTLPTGGTAGTPGTWTALSANPMKLRLNSTSSTAAAYGTEITGGGYTAGGTAFASSATAITSPANSISLPVTTAFSWTNSSGSTWQIQSLDITDGAVTPVRVWWGDFSGALPINVTNGSVFQIATGGITASLTLRSRPRTCRT